MNSFAEEETDAQSSIRVTSVPTDILRDLLDEYRGKIDITGSSKVLTTSLKFAVEISKPFKESGTSYKPAITVVSDQSDSPDNSPDKEPAQGKVNVQPLSSVQEKYYTLAFVHIATDNQAEILQSFKWVQYALQPKGIAIIICPKIDSVVNIINSALAKKLQQSGTEEDAAVINGNETEKALTKDGILETLLAKASFERGKMRTLERRNLKTGAAVDEAKTAMKAELERTLGPDESGKGWTKAFENAFWSETKQHGGLVLESQVLIVRKWDEITA